jgi:hypothetical protein
MSLLTHSIILKVAECQESNLGYYKQLTIYWYLWLRMDFWPGHKPLHQLTPLTFKAAGGGTSTREVKQPLRSAHHYTGVRVAVEDYNIK